MLTRGITRYFATHVKLAKQQLIDKNGDWLCALSVTCHEKEEYFWLKYLQSLRNLQSSGSVWNDSQIRSGLGFLFFLMESR